MMPISRAWIAVWRRNYLVWKKLAAESVLGNVIEPLFYMVGFGDFCGQGQERPCCG